MTDAELEQQRIHLEQQRDTSKMWGFLREFRAAVEGDIKSIKQILYGVNGDNGFNGRLKMLEANHETHEKEFTELKSKLTHYVDIERLETCHGIAAVAAHERKHEEKEKEETAVKVAKINAGSASWVQFLQLAGILFVAVLTFLGKK